MAIGSMTTNSTVDLIDKTLTTENAPADAKAVGDYILDRTKDTPQPIFYSKAAVDELLAGKLDLTGGAMSGKILINVIGSDVIKISGSTENADEEIEFERTDTGAVLACGIGAGGNNMGLYDRTNRKWAFHVKATTGDIYIGGTKCIGFVVASGDNYVRFGDGTQICWGEVLNVPTGTFVTFPLAFSAIPRFTMTRQYGAPTGGAAQSVWGYNTNNTGTYIGGEINIYSHWIAIGRWK